jgi:hypothetical protein
MNFRRIIYIYLCDIPFNLLAKVYFRYLTFDLIGLGAYKKDFLEIYNEDEKTIFKKYVKECLNDNITYRIKGRNKNEKNI